MSSEWGSSTIDYFGTTSPITQTYAFAHSSPIDKPRRRSIISIPDCVVPLSTPPLSAATSSATSPTSSNRSSWSSVSSSPVSVKGCLKRPNSPRKQSNKVHWSPANSPRVSIAASEEKESYFNIPIEEERTIFATYSRSEYDRRSVPTVKLSFRDICELVEMKKDVERQRTEFALQQAIKAAQAASQQQVQFKPSDEATLYALTRRFSRDRSASIQEQMAMAPTPLKDQLGFAPGIGFKRGRFVSVDLSTD